MTNTDMNKVTTQDAPPIDQQKKFSLVKIRKGKLVFKQKSISFEKMSETMQEIVEFRRMLEERRAAKKPPLSEVPDEHKPVIAKLVHESDKTLQTLSKNIQQELVPPRTTDEDVKQDSVTPNILPLETVENAINSVARRVNYGLDRSSEGDKVPAAWHVWRWELLDLCRDYLPKAVREMADKRLRERQQAKNDLDELFESLPSEEKAAIIGSKVDANVAVKPKNGTKDATVSDIIDLSDAVGDTAASEPPTAVPETNTVNTVNAKENAQDVSEKKTLGRSKRPVDPEKEAKERERQEKKAAKAERDKKAQAAQAKSRSLMANFFGKANSTTTSTVSPSKSTNDGETGSSGLVTTQSDFQRTFLPFAIKKDAELAPKNWFDERKRRTRQQRSRNEGNVIVVDDDEGEMKADPQDIDMTDAVDITTMTPQEYLRDVLARFPSGLNPPRRPRQPTGYKTYNPLSVRGLMSQITEAEVAGDDTEVRRLLSVLRDRGALPAKVLVFNEDTRPGYFGTFTRSSQEVGPRTPFARDVVQIDYGYDSGEEWAEEDAGEADDVMEDADEEGDADSDADSDMDDWLVDDDEVEDPGTLIEERSGSPVLPSFDLVPSGSAFGKRKAKEEKQKEKEKGGGSKKRRVVVPLVPFTKGPEWETTVGRCAYEPFKAYRILLFNDTPFPIDPFKFVSEPVDHQPSGSTATHHRTADGFAIPALPPHIAKLPASLPSSSSTESIATSAKSAKRVSAAPKTPFPDAHLPYLLERIEELATSSVLAIVEAVYRDLQVHCVKKNAIEAKIKEVGEKCKFRKIWVVKPEVKVQYGLS